MYSYEERRIAIKLCCKYDGRVSATVRPLGYPSIKQLRRWYCRYLQTDLIPVAEQRRPQYSELQRAAAVLHYFDITECLARTCRVLGNPSMDLLR